MVNFEIMLEELANMYGFYVTFGTFCNHEKNRIDFSCTIEKQTKEDEFMELEFTGEYMIDALIEAWNWVIKAENGGENNG